MSGQMSQITTVTDRAGVLAATGDHPYPRLTTGGTVVHGFAVAGAALWCCPDRSEESYSGIGDPAAAVRLLVALREREALAGVSRVHLPRVDHRLLAAELPVGPPDHWEFRWATAPPPWQPGEEQVLRLGRADEPAVTALLAEAFPESFTRPGDSRVRCWYGIRDGRDRGRLIACGADQSGGGVGSLAALTVHPRVRGRGWGAALTAAMTRALFGSYHPVSLGVLAGNAAAVRLYRRLGFTQVAERTSVDLGPPAAGAPLCG